MTHAKTNFKVFLCILSVLLIAAMLPGCNLIPADITELESPPRLTSEQQAIENALRSKVKSFTLKYPLDGEIRSAFVTHDFDHDGVDEALAFYSPGSTQGPHIAYLAKVNGKWKDLGELDSAGSEGSEIDCVTFGNFEETGVDDVVVGWRGFNTTDLTLMVYSRNPNGTFSKTNLGSFTKIATLDMTGDTYPDILKLKLANDEKQSVASLISYKNGKLQIVAQAPLDSTVSSYAGVYALPINAQISGVLVDGYKATHKMVSELFYYNNGRLFAPFYNKSTHTVTKTLRDQAYQSMDINKDNIMDIPMPTGLPYVADKKNDNQPFLVQWMDYGEKSGLSSVLSTVMNYPENYYFISPKKWGRKVTVDRRSNTIWNFDEWDAVNNTYGRELFSIQVFSESGWISAQSKGNYYELEDKSGTVYAAYLPQQKVGDPLSLSIDEIRDDYFKLLGD